MINKKMFHQHRVYDQRKHIANLELRKSELPSQAYQKAFDSMINDARSFLVLLEKRT